MAEGQPTFWDTIKGVAGAQASKVLQPLSGTFSTVLGNVTGTAQGKVQGVAEKLVSTTAPSKPNPAPSKVDPTIPDTARDAGFATTSTIMGLVVAALLLWFLTKRGN